MENRVKIVRKRNGLTQTEFAGRIGMSRAAIASIEIGRVTPTDSFIKLVSATFNVREEWLRDGTGEMMIERPEDTIDRLADEYDLDALERAVLEAYLNLDDGARAVMRSYMDTVADRVRAIQSKPVTAEKEWVKDEFVDDDQNSAE